MTEAEVNQFLKLYDKFNNKCSKICNELSRYKSYWKYMDQFSIEDGSIRCEGDEYWPYGGHEHHEDCFDIELLSYSDKELEDYVDILVEEKNKKLRKEQAEKAARQKEYDLKQLQAIKDKYGL